MVDIQPMADNWQDWVEHAILETLFTTPSPVGDSSVIPKQSCSVVLAGYA